MKCIDSNIIIDIAKRRLSPMLVFSDTTTEYAVSVITTIECLGFSFPDDTERDAVLFIFRGTIEQPITTAIRNKAIELRSKQRINLGDAIIAATALERCGGVLLTRNIDDFKNIQGIVVINPYTTQP